MWAEGQTAGDACATSAQRALPVRGGDTLRVPAPFSGWGAGRGWGRGAFDKTNQGGVRAVRSRGGASARDLGSVSRSEAAAGCQLCCSVNTVAVRRKVPGWHVPPAPMGLRLPLLLSMVPDRSICSEVLCSERPPPA